jgi:radical SAM superfamily enzyme YgiQ (UPF0313 family)
MLLIHPPVSKPCEPPAGIARLTGAVEGNGKNLTVVDANLDGILRILNSPVSAEDTWTRRSKKNVQKNLQYLRDKRSHWDVPRYTRCVGEINRLLEKFSNPGHIRLSLNNYQDDLLSPVKSRDLIRSAGEPEKSPFYPWFSEWLSESNTEAGGSIVGFSLNFLSQAIPAFAMIGYLRKQRPDAKVILGGGLVTSWMSMPDWRNPFTGLVDEMIAGPGEAYLRDMIGVEKTGTHVRPRYDIFPLDDYLSPGLILPYSASSGCYWRKCMFCPEEAEGNPYTPVAVANVLDDLDFLIAEHRPAMVHFLDNAMSPALLKALINHPLNVPWYGFVRMTDHFKDLDFCMGLKRSGCVMLKIGIESGDQKVLDHLHKGIDLESASLSLRNIKKAGIGTYLYFLFGTPPEGPAEAMHTLEFVKRHHNEIDFMNLAIFNMPLHGPDANNLVTNKFYEGDLSLYSNFEHPKEWSRDLVRNFLENEFKRDPLVRPILMRNPPFFTSNHAAFFLLSK